MDNDSTGEPSVFREPLIVAFSYTFFRAVGDILEDFLLQGLRLWHNERKDWYWRWEGTHLHSTYGMRSLSEALVDAIQTRFPTYFDVPPMPDRAVTD